MSQAFITFQGSLLQLSDYESIRDPKVWLSVASSWTGSTIFDPKYSKYEAKFKDWFGPYAEGLSLAQRSEMNRWATHLARSASSAPDDMPIDKALVSNQNFRFQNVKTGDKVTSSECIITTKQGDVSIKACRVPVPDPLLPKDASSGVRSAWQGSDIVAASLGAMTKWNDGVTVSIPIDTLDKFGFDHMDPKDLPVLARIPVSGPEGVGMKGRVWAHHLMRKFNSMPKSTYFQIADLWCKSVFKLPVQEPATHQNPPAWLNQQPEWVKRNFDIKAMRYSVKVAQNTPQGKVWVAQEQIGFFWYPTFKDARLLRAFQHSFDSKVSDYVTSYAAIQLFSTVQQGTSVGIGMLAQARDSWGLPSQELSWIEQAVSILVAQDMPRIVLIGWSQFAVRAIRASVCAWRPDHKVYELVNPIHADPLLFKTADVEQSFLVNFGATTIGTGVKAEYRGTVSYYSPTLVLSRHWTPVENFFSFYKGHRAVYLGCVLPPFSSGEFNVETKLHIYVPKMPWDAFAVISNVADLKEGLWSDGKLLDPSPIKKVEAKVFHGLIASTMNEVMSVWAVPFCRIQCAKTALLKPHTLSTKEKAIRIYDGATGDFETTWIDVSEHNSLSPVPPALPAANDAPVPGAAPAPFVLDEDQDGADFAGGDEPYDPNM